jgi:hypothetical protein
MTKTDLDKINYSLEDDSGKRRKILRKAAKRYGVNSIIKLLNFRANYAMRSSPGEIELIKSDVRYLMERKFISVKPAATPKRATARSRSQKSRKPKAKKK